MAITYQIKSKNNITLTLWLEKSGENEPREILLRLHDDDSSLIPSVQLDSDNVKDLIFILKTLDIEKLWDNYDDNDDNDE